MAALRANDSDLFKRWLYGGIEDLGEPAVVVGSNDNDELVYINAYSGGKKNGRIKKLSFSVDSDKTCHTDLYIDCDVRNVRKFLRSIGDDFKDLKIGPGNIDNFAKEIDALPGIAPGDGSTRVSLLDGQYEVLA